MLVLSRKKGESVVVNGNIKIVVVDIRGDKARIGIEAPADVAVYRSEVLAKSATASESGEAAKGGETVASKTFREKKNVDETQKRGKSKGGRGARSKPTDGPVGENSVETLYLSNENEAYRNVDAPRADERNASNAELETEAAKNDVK